MLRFEWSKNLFILSEPAPVIKTNQMHILIEKLKISNFLSFLGEYEVNLKPFTAVICNFYEGKDDLFRAFEFVLGAKITDLRVDNPLELVHKVLREEFLISRAIDTYVEITLRFLQENKELKFCRSVKNGAHSLRIEHKISDLITSSLLYEEKLSSLGICISQKNLILYKSYFNNIIWGSAEDLEMTICTCLRESYLLEDWRRMNKDVEYLKKLKDITAEKHYNAIKKSHFVIEKYTTKYQKFFANRETTVKKILLDVTNDSSSDNTPSLLDFTAELSVEEAEKKAQEILSLEKNILFVTEKLDELKFKAAFLTSHLYHEEIKLATKPVNASILQNRISHLKAAVLKKEKQISEIWERTQTIKFELKSLSQKISFVLNSLQEIQVKNYRQNRFTQYGRFYDYLQPSRYIQLLKQIIGPDIFYAHLCDSTEDAFSLIVQIKELKYEYRETFLPFGSYSYKLKDLITASGERGIQINTLEELLVFLCKLNHYQLIDEVPVIVQRNFNFENVVADDYIIYIQNNIHFTSDGLISCRTDENDFSLESEKELLENLSQLYEKEEMNYRKWDDLLFMKWEALTDMNSLENDLFFLKQKWRKSTHTSPTLQKASVEMEIYKEYYDIFKECEQERNKYESQLQLEEQFLMERHPSTPSNEESIGFIMKDLEQLLEEKRNTQTQLEDFTQKLRQLCVTPVYAYITKKNVIKFENNSDKNKYFLEKEYKKLKKLMKEDDLEDFMGVQEWRKTFINSLIKDFEEIKKKLKTSSDEFLNIATARKRKLYQLFEHCSRYLSSTFSQILNDALPFININFASEEEKIQIMTCLGEEKINVVDIMHFNTLLKFLSAFSLFLEIAKFENISLLIIDDIEEYFPTYNDNLEAVLELSTLEKILPNNENPRFHLLMRLGQYLKLYIKKNTPHKLVRSNGSSKGDTDGPVQIIYFVKEDLVHAAEHCIWIQNKSPMSYIQGKNYVLISAKTLNTYSILTLAFKRILPILPEEYLSDNCNSYSEIHEINLTGFNN